MAMNFLLPILLGFAFGFAYRYVLKHFKSKKIQVRSKRNIGKGDRLFRFFLGVILTILGLSLSSSALIFAAGFCYFEAIFSWCGFYAILGKNTCEL